MESCTDKTIITEFNSRKSLESIFIFMFYLIYLCSDFITINTENALCINSPHKMVINVEKPSSTNINEVLFDNIVSCLYSLEV